MANEEWRPVKGFEDRYEVSNLGRAKTVARLRDAGGGRWARIKERIGLGYVDTQGYRSCNLGRQKKITVHRLVCEAFHGSPPAGKTHVAHFDGDGLNNRAENLRWVDAAENNRDMVRHGRTTAGERAPNARLTASDVRAIRTEAARLGASPGLCREIAGRRGLERRHVYLIVSRKTWKHI